MIELLVAPISALLSKVIPDLDERNRLAHEIATMAEKQAHDQIMAQLAVNEQEAAHKSLFVAGARPFILWTCGISMAFNFVGLPLIEAVSIIVGDPLTLDPLNLEVMMPVLLGMLGLGSMRTYEKRHGVAREK
jgi:hypothetical protein